nr:WD-40 repeat-containing protein MSI1 [Ipomoea batatas]
MSSSVPLPTESQLRSMNDFWNSYAGCLYHMFINHSLDWPTPTVEWLPDGEETVRSHYTVQKLIVGTRAAGNAQNSLLLAQVRLPREDKKRKKKSSSSAELGKIEIVQQINHDGVVNRARYMPQNPSIVATKTGSAELFMFDCTKHPSNPPEEGVCNPDLRLTGHKDKGNALSWSPLKQGYLLSGSDDGQICIWDVNATPNDKALEAMHIFDIQHGCAKDVAWHMKNENLFGSVGEDKYLRIWDIRTPVIKLNQSVLSHEAMVNSLAFNPINGWVVATGSSDRKVILFDLRMISSSLQTLEWPLQEEVDNVRWSHKRENILASSSGKKLLVWDTSRSNAMSSGSPPTRRELLAMHELWKSNAQNLYDMVVIYNSDWPTPTVEWLPDGEEPEGESYTVQKLIVGTRAPENEQNSLLLLQVRLPRDDWEGEQFSSSVEMGKVEIVQRINHDGVVNRARYMPQNPSIVATKTGSAELFMFDCTKYPSNPPEEGVCNPDLRLTGHKDKGNALSWSPLKQGYLLSGSDDGQICIWDVNATPNDKTLEAMHIFDIQHGCAKDVAWHMKNENLFGSVGEDNYLRIWDIRTPVIKLNQSVLSHEAMVNSLAFNPINGWVVATGSSDRKVILFDLRMISSSLQTLERPLQEEVDHVRWNHKRENILASSCAGKKLLVWDISRIGRIQTSEEEKAGPPEFVFLHFGHMDSITDFSWSPTYDSAIASAANDNSLHIVSGVTMDLPEFF